ncbi:MAG: hypothetical protein U0905_09965 [Pirellulales bacterium]
MIFRNSMGSDVRQACFRNSVGFLASYPSQPIQTIAPRHHDLPDRWTRLHSPQADFFSD